MSEKLHTFRPFNHEFQTDGSARDSTMQLLQLNLQDRNPLAQLADLNLSGFKRFSLLRHLHRMANDISITYIPHPRQLIRQRHIRAMDAERKNFVSYLINLFQKFGEPSVHARPILSARAEPEPLRPRQTKITIFGMKALLVLSRLEAEHSRKHSIRPQFIHSGLRPLSNSNLDHARCIGMADYIQETQLSITKVGRA